jgi:hypothetical protein
MKHLILRLLLLRNALVVAVAVLFAMLTVSCGRGKPTFTGEQLHTIVVAGTAPHATLNNINIEPTYEERPPFSSIIQPPVPCDGHPDRALVFVADDPRTLSVVLFVNSSGKVVCWERSHIFNVRSAR